MLIVETIARIRREHFIKGKTIKEIARDLKVSRNTVRKGSLPGFLAEMPSADLRPHDLAAPDDLSRFSAHGGIPAALADARMPPGRDAVNGRLAPGSVKQRDLQTKRPQHRGAMRAVFTRLCQTGSPAWF
jgi:hypothetical protein